MRRWAVALAPWAAVGLLVWRQRGLEARMERWVVSVGETMRAFQVIDQLAAEQAQPGA